MNEDQRLSMLDRRAADATSALDDAVQQVPVREPDLGAPRRSIRRFLPLAVAAGLAVLALVGAALLFEDEEQGTIAGQPGGITRLALPDPESLGYRIVGAFDGSRSSAAPDATITMTIHSPADLPRWERPVVSYSLAADRTTLSGETVDVGGPEAFLTPSGGIPMIGWAEGDRVRFIGGRGYSADELITLATRTIAEDIQDGAPLPGHEVIHVAPHTDVYPALIMSASAKASDVAGIGYQSDDDVFVVTTSAGSLDRWRASFALAAATERLTVRGQEAVRADFGDGLTEISWLEADGTLVRVEAFGAEVPVDVLEQLEPISEADLADLVDEHGIGDDVEVHHFDEMGEEIEAGEVDAAPEPILPDATTTDDRVPVAEVRTEDGDLSLRARLVRSGDVFHIEIDAESSDGGSGISQEVADTATNVALRDAFASDAWSGVLIGGLIGPGVGPLRIVDAATGEQIDTNGPSTANIEESDHVVFLATIGPQHRDRDLVVVGTTAAGGEIRLEVPAQP